MEGKVEKQRLYLLLIILCLIKLIFHLLSNSTYGFHRDEFLYMDYARHLHAGYYDVPPLTALLAWLTDHFMGDSVAALRFLPAVSGTCTLLIAGLLVIELDGGSFALLLTGMSLIVSVLLRVDTLFQPVTFDVLFWTLSGFFLIRYLHRGRKADLIWLGLVFGLGILNKYTILMWGSAALAGTLLFHRHLLREPTFYLALLITLAVCAPNLYWQVMHHFPAIAHVNALARSQFIHVSSKEILLSQVIFFGPGSVLWLMGLVFVCTNQGRKYRLIGLSYLLTIGILICFRGKSYYSLGIYPCLIALGAVYLEKIQVWAGFKVFRIAFPVIILIYGVLLLPAAAPVLPAPYLIRYCAWLSSAYNLEFRHWEDGQVHKMPQDFADMFGWEEGAQKTMYWYYSIPEKERMDYILCASDYGLAASLDYYGLKKGLPDVYNDSSGMIDWLPFTIHAHKVLYIGNSLKKDLSMFRTVTLVDSIVNPYSREKGTYIAYATDCKTDLPALWNRIYLEKKAKGPFRPDAQ